MPIEKVILDNNFLFRTLVSSIKASNFEAASDVAHSLSLLWKYLVILTDECLYTQKQRYDNLKSKFDQNVQEELATKVKRFTTERMNLEQKIVGYKENIETLEK